MCELKPTAIQEHSSTFLNSLNTLSCVYQSQQCFGYLGVGDGQAVHRLRRLEQLDLLDHVRLGAQDHHPLQPALLCNTRRANRETGSRIRRLEHPTVSLSRNTFLNKGCQSIQLSSVVVIFAEDVFAFGLD